MGKKRRHEDPDEKIRRKIRRLNEKLKKRQRIIYSDDDDEESIHSHDAHCNNDSTPTEPASEVEVNPHCSREPVPDVVRSHEGTEPDPPLSQEVDALLDVDHSVEMIPNAEADAESPDAEDSGLLETEVLEMLGEAPEPETILGKAIHKDVAARWLDIIKKGLNKDTKEKLAKEYLIPANCELILPPILNPEAKAALSEPFVKRDSSLMYRQKQIGNALAALAPAIDIIIDKGFDPELRQKLLRPVSDACRLLCDMHHNETKIRKKFVVSSISTGLKDTLASSNTDKYLFGDNMTEKIKNAKNVQKSGEALKITPKPQKQNYTKNFPSRKNFKPLHQKITGKQDAGKSHPAPRQYQQQSSRAPPRRAAPERSPPPSPRRRNGHTASSVPYKFS